MVSTSEPLAHSNISLLVITTDSLQPGSLNPCALSNTSTVDHNSGQRDGGLADGEAAPLGGGVLSLEERVPEQPSAPALKRASPQSSDSIARGGSKYNDGGQRDAATDTTTGSGGQRTRRDRQPSPSRKRPAATLSAGVEPSRSRARKPGTPASMGNGIDQSPSSLSNPGQGGLSASFQDLQSKGSAMLEQRAVQLEHALKEKDAELARLKQLVAAKTVPWCAAEQLPGPSASANSAPTITEQELKQAYCSSVQALKDYITITNLGNYDIAGKNLPDKVTADIKGLVHTISKVCLQILKPETPFVLETISKDYSSITTADWELDKSHWINVIAQLQLSNLQVLSILHARELHVAKMSVLLQERATLAKQAAELMAAAASSAPGASGAYDDVANVSVLVQHGYLYFARNALLLHRIAEMFKESMLREQKTVMELFLKVLYQVLSPVQAALFVVEAFPYHCDVLALANVLALLFGKDGSGNVGMGAGTGPNVGMGDGLDAMAGLGPMGPGAEAGSSSGAAAASAGSGGFTPQDALMLHQRFAGGGGGGGGGSGLQERSSSGLQMQGGLGSGDLGAAAAAAAGSLGGPSQGGGAGPSRLNPFGVTAAMAEQISLLGQGGSGSVSNPGNGGSGGGLGGTGSGQMSAAAVQQELQSLQAAALARQAGAGGHGGDVSGLLSGCGSGNAGLMGSFSGQHALGMSSNLSSLASGLADAMGSGQGGGPGGSLSDLLRPGGKMQQGLGQQGGRQGGASGGGGNTPLFMVGAGGSAAGSQAAGQQQGAGTPSLNLSMPGGGLGGGGVALGALPLSAMPRTEALSGMQQGSTLPISAVSRYGSGNARGPGLLDGQGSGAALLLGGQVGGLNRSRLPDL